VTTFASRFAPRVVAACVVLSLSVAANAYAQRPALTRDVDNPALAPVRILININLNPGETFKTVNSITVPVGKRLVIENASIWAFSSSAADVVTGVWLSPLNVSHFHLLDPAANEIRNMTGNSAVAAYNRTIKAYFEAGETLQGWAFYDGTNGSKTVNIYLQGYYVTP
jgi:hypothetical protein